MEDLLDLDLPPTTSLTKAEAVRLLIELTNDLIKSGVLPPTTAAVDWNEVVDGNVRSRIPPSAVRTGQPRGNRGRWGCIPFRIQPRGKNHILLFDQLELGTWFYTTAVAVLVKHYSPKVA